MEASQKKSKKKVVIGVLLFVAAVWFSGIATFYSSADVEGRILDEETGKPIEGAVMIGIWQLESQSFEHYYGDAIHVVESVTDAEGRYHLEGFALKWVGFPGGQLWNSDPHVSVYAEGYKPGGARRDSILERGRGFRRVSPLNGQDIGLKRKALDDRFIANIWGSGVQKLLDAGGCTITELPALKVLLGKLEPQYDKYIKDFYGTHETPFRNATKRCIEGRKELRGQVSRCCITLNS